MKRFSRFDLASFGLLAFITLFSLARYNYLPQFIDGYYHLSVANGFVQSGGWVNWDWWSFAPLGRPHLYPPLYHLILVFLEKVGLSGLAAVKVTEVAIAPLFFFVFWLVTRKLINGKFSFINLLVLSSFFSFFSSVSANLPASLSIIFGLLSWYFIQKKKSVSAVIFLTLAFYTHSGLPWVFFLSLLLVSLFNREYRAVSIRTAGVSLLFSLPLLGQALSKLDYLNIQVLGEANFIHFSLIILGIGLPFLFFNFSNRSLTTLLFLGYLFGTALIFIHYPYRFFSAQGAIGLAFFTALFLDKVSNSLKPGAKKLFFGLTALVFLVFHPTLDLDDNQLEVDFLNSTYYNFLSGEFNQLFEFKPIFSQKLYGPIVQTIKENTGPEDIIYSNLSSAAEVFSSLSLRPTANSLFLEVKPKEDFKPYEYAKVIVWIKPLLKEEFSGIRDIQWDLVYENDIAYVFLNSKYQPSLRKIKSNFGFRMISFVLVCAVVFLVLDNISLIKSKVK